MITYRCDRTKTIAGLREHNIRFENVVLVDWFYANVEVVTECGVTMDVDDQHKMLKNIPPGVRAMPFRNQRSKREPGLLKQYRSCHPERCR